MKYKWFEEYCTSKKGAYKEHKAEWEVDRFMIRDKMFGMRGCDNNGKEIITLKLNPLYGQLLREQYKDVIVPGYYMNRYYGAKTVKPHRHPRKTPILLNPTSDRSGDSPVLPPN